MRVKPSTHTDAPRPAPRIGLPPRSRGRPQKTERPQRFPRRDHPIKHHVAGPEPTRAADRSKPGRPRTQTPPKTQHRHPRPATPVHLTTSARTSKLETFIERSERVAEQIHKRMRGEPITDRLISIFDPDARPIRKGKLGKPNEFGFVAQLCEVTENTKTGARGLIVPAAAGELGNPTEDTLLPDTIAELQRLGISPQEVALDGGFNIGPTTEALAPFDPERTFIAGRQQPGSRRTQRRLARYRTGSEGRISHMKRGYGLRRSRLKDHEGMQAWTGWSILTYNLDTVAIRTS